MAATKSKTNGHGSTSNVAARDDARRKTPAPGSRLAEAFEAVERFPVLLESRERVMRAATAETARVGEIIEAVESDVALTMAVLQFANRSGARNSGTIASIPVALEVLKPSGVLAIAGTAPTYDFFEPNGGWELRPEHFRIHALASQRAADRVARAAPEARPAIRVPTRRPAGHPPPHRRASAPADRPGIVPSGMRRRLHGLPSANVCGRAATGRRQGRPQ